MRIVFFVLAIIYIAAFVRLPKVDYEKSTYTVLCNGMERGLGNFDYVPGKYVDVQYDELQRPRFFYKKELKEADVVAKFICADKKLLEKDPKEVRAGIETSPDFERVAMLAPNYHLDIIAFEHPSSGEFTGQCLVALFLIAGGLLYPHVRKLL